MVFLAGQMTRSRVHTRGWNMWMMGNAKKREPLLRGGLQFSVYSCARVLRCVISSFPLVFKCRAAVRILVLLYIYRYREERNIVGGVASARAEHCYWNSVLRGIREVYLYIICVWPYVWAKNSGTDFALLCDSCCGRIYLLFRGDLYSIFFFSRENIVDVHFCIYGKGYTYANLGNKFDNKTSR